MEVGVLFCCFFFVEYLKMMGANKVLGLCNIHIRNNVKCKLIIFFVSISIVNLGGGIEGTHGTLQVVE
jgi:hypothetical protein